MVEARGPREGLARGAQEGGHGLCLEAFFLTTLLPEAALLLVSLCGCPDGVECVWRCPTASSAFVASALARFVILAECLAPDAL